MVIYLYLKKHNITGLKYLGITRQDPYIYNGSGSFWTKHIKKHGLNISTEILKELHSYEEVSHWGKHYSDLFNIVESEEFANLVPELGENSCGMKGKKHKTESKERIRNSLLNHPVSEEARKNISLGLMGISPWNKGKSGYTVHSDLERERRSVAYSGSKNPFYNKDHSLEFKDRQRNNQKRIIECPHCKKEGAVRIMKRWHFENCRNKENSNV